MHIEKLGLINFKNYESLSLTFSDKLNCIVGKNGSGKTNILDAIYFLSMTKSAHNPMDNQNIKFDQEYFSIKATFVNSKATDTVVCYFKEGEKKSFKINKEDYSKLSEHIGRFPVVLITPYDSDIIRESSEIRRKFFDSIICQLDHDYMINLVRYNKNLKQRNSALKSFSKAGKVNYDLLENYNHVLLDLGLKIFKKRKSFIDTNLNSFYEYYAFISGENEKVEIVYGSQFDVADVGKKLNDYVKKDIVTERSNFGIHKDDFHFYIEQNQLKKYGSQGQQKSFSIALKLMQFKALEMGLKLKPILLLDDIFDKLDSTRINKLLSMIKEGKFHQVFITDAIIDRTESLLKEFELEPNIYLVDNSKVELKE
ncbi:DNA replication/repair protein RecF [Fulvivirga lutea]|uniref:DNA replication and repair protein RecF n=1 Tax=Fulvivirga lutea TaxID=2810512 RepID=A0A974WJX3_9BACT|nr:DNA replication and repair protein RecF [Fulvivirga lutea]QSE97520.1 DNA replication and repair protein RecF [Fulvivirga lutea]